MRKLLLLSALLVFPVSVRAIDCTLRDFVVDPSPAWYGERVDVQLAGSCPHGVPPRATRVLVTGSTISIELRDSVGGTLVPVDWAARVHLGKLLPGVYEIVLRTQTEEWARRTLEVRQRPFEVLPMVGRGGDTVVIRGFDEVDCGGAVCDAFTFDGVPATEVRAIHDEQGTAFVVRVPQHAPGVVNVQVRTAPGRFVTLHGGFRYGDAADADFERVLIPMNYQGAGVNGSSWDTDVVVVNTLPIGLVTHPLLGFVRNLPAALLTPPPYGPLRANGRGFFPTRPFDGGAFLYVPRGTERHLAYGARVVNRAAAGGERGAELPVVRASDTAAVIRLADVPLQRGSRAMLRVYDFDATPSRFVLVQVRLENGTVHSIRATVRAQTIACPTTPCLQPRPGFAALDLTAFDHLANAGFADVTVIGPGDARLWAFVSVTNNENQHVTLFTPQHRRPD